MAKNIYSDNLLFALSKADKDNEYEFYYFYYKDEQAIRVAFDVICQLFKNLTGIEITLKNSENIDE
ncbi:MAG: hypothetical protein VZR53_11185 [Prevotella sp.]|nr:hypothetical protein [Prevotella sp.]